MAQHVQTISKQCGVKVKHHFVTSTVLTSALNRANPSWQGLSKAIHRQLGQVPLCYINAYECTGWGYILRLMRQLELSGQPVLISILDVNAFDMTCWNQHEQWGDSGFGLMTLLLRNTVDDVEAAEQLQISASTGTNPFNHFALTVRKQLMTDETLCAAMPFFPRTTQALFDRILANFPHLADRHPQWGHCFGSDPWLSILLSHREGYDFNQHSQILTCSLAYSGYFSLARIRPKQDGLFNLLPSVQEQET